MKLLRSGLGRYEPPRGRYPPICLGPGQDPGIRHPNPLDLGAPSARLVWTTTLSAACLALTSTYTKTTHHRDINHSNIPLREFATSHLAPTLFLRKEIIRYQSGTMTLEVIYVTRHGVSATDITLPFPVLSFLSYSPLSSLSVFRVGGKTLVRSQILGLGVAT